MQDYYVTCKLRIVGGKHIHTQTHDLYATPEEMGGGGTPRVMSPKLFIPLRMKKMTFREKSCPPQFLITFFASLLFIETRVFSVKIQFLIKLICGGWGSLWVRMMLLSECSWGILNETMQILAV